MESNIKGIWERRKGEKKKQRQAFEKYLVMPVRSYKILAEDMGTSERTIRRWATKWGWKQRVEAFDLAAQKEAQDTIEEIVYDRERPTSAISLVFERCEAIHDLVTLLLLSRLGDKWSQERLKKKHVSIDIEDKDLLKTAAIWSEIVVRNYGHLLAAKAAGKEDDVEEIDWSSFSDEELEEIEALQEKAKRKRKVG